MVLETKLLCLWLGQIKSIMLLPLLFSEVIFEALKIGNEIYVLDNTKTNRSCSDNIPSSFVRQLFMSLFDGINNDLLCDPIALLHCSDARRSR